MTHPRKHPIMPLIALRKRCNTVEVGIQGAPPPGEIPFAPAMSTGGRIRVRLGGRAQQQVSVHDGQG